MNKLILIALLLTGCTTMRVAAPVSEVMPAHAVDCRLVVIAKGETSPCKEQRQQKRVR